MTANANARTTKAIEDLVPGEVFYALVDPGDNGRRAVEVVLYPEGKPRPFVMVRFAYLHTELNELFGERNMTFYEWGELVEVVGTETG